MNCMTPLQETKFSKVESCWRSQVRQSVYFDHKLAKVCNIHTSEWVRPMLLAHLSGASHILLFVYSEATDLLHYVARDEWVDRVAQKEGSLEETTAEANSDPTRLPKYRAIPGQRVMNGKDKGGPWFSWAELIWRERKILYFPDVLARDHNSAKNLEVYNCRTGELLEPGDKPESIEFNNDVDRLVLIRSTVGAPLVPKEYWQRGTRGQKEVDLPIGVLFFFNELPNSLFWAYCMRASDHETKFKLGGKLQEIATLLSTYWYSGKADELLWQNSYDPVKEEWEIQEVMEPIYQCIASPPDIDTNYYKMNRIAYPKVNEWLYHKTDINETEEDYKEKRKKLQEISDWFLGLNEEGMRELQKDEKTITLREFSKVLGTCSHKEWHQRVSEHLDPAAAFPAGPDHLLVDLCDRFYRLLKPEVDRVTRNYIDTFENFPVLDKEEIRIHEESKNKLLELYGEDIADLNIW